MDVIKALFALYPELLDNIIRAVYLKNIPRFRKLTCTPASPVLTSLLNPNFALIMNTCRVSSKRSIALYLSQRRCYSAPTDGAIPAAKQKYVPTSGTYPKGFKAGSAHAGVKASNTKYDDLALIASEKPGPAAGVFTVNAFKAAPVQISDQILGTRNGRDIRGVVINSGCANAVTGKGGMMDAIAMAKKADECFPAGSEPKFRKNHQGQKDEENIDEDANLSITKAVYPLQTLVMSTGVIGQRFVLRPTQCA